MTPEEKAVIKAAEALADEWGQGGGPVEHLVALRKAVNANKRRREALEGVRT